MDSASVKVYLSEKQKSDLNFIKEKYHNGETVVVFIKSTSHIDASLIAEEIKHYCNMNSTLFCLTFGYDGDDISKGHISCQITATKPHGRIASACIGFVNIE